MEQLFTHNRVKLRIASALDALITSEDLGYFVADRMLLHNEFADFATEPDGMFISYASIESEKAQLKEGVGAGVVEIVGTPDMVLEVVSDSSEHKDNVELMDLYGQAGIPEYWLVDVRSEPYHFDIFKKAGKGYVATRRLAGGWLKSAVYGRAFHLAAQTDALGHPQFTLEVR